MLSRGERRLPGDTLSEALELLENEFTANSGTLRTEELQAQSVLRAALGRRGLGAGGGELDVPQEPPEPGLSPQHGQQGRGGLPLCPAQVRPHLHSCLQAGEEKLWGI